jgi:hypothetical protein
MHEQLGFENGNIPAAGLDIRQIEEYQESVLKEADEAFKYFNNSID